MGKRRITLPPSLSAQVAASLHSRLRVPGVDSDPYEHRARGWADPQTLRSEFFSKATQSDDGRELPHLDWGDFYIESSDSVVGMHMLTTLDNRCLTEIVDATLLDGQRITGVIRGLDRDYRDGAYDPLWSYAIRFMAARPISDAVTCGFCHPDYPEVGEAFVFRSHLAEKGWRRGHEGWWEFCSSSYASTLVHEAFAASPHFYNPSSTSWDELVEDGLLRPFALDQSDGKVVLTLPGSPFVRLANLRDVAVYVDFWSEYTGKSLNDSFWEGRELAGKYAPIGCDYAIATSPEAFSGARLVLERVAPDSHLVQSILLQMGNSTFSRGVAASIARNGVYVSSKQHRLLSGSGLEVRSTNYVKGL